MSAHTPGPWQIVRGPSRIYVHDACDNKLCIIVKWTESVDLADARLIASAPELLSALKLFVDAVKYNRLYMGFEKAFEVGSELVEKLEGCK